MTAIEVAQVETASSTPAQRVEAAVLEWSRALTETSELEWIANIVQRIKQSLKLDYGQDAQAFAAAYHEVNYRKTLKSLQDVRPPYNGPIADLGCGSGASTAAAIAYVLDRDPKIDEIIVRLVDDSRQQLRLAKNCLDAIQAALPEVNLELQLIERTLPDGVLHIPKSKLVVAAHLLTEADTPVDLVEAAEDLVLEGGTLVIIERTDDRVWDRIASCVDSLAWDHQSGCSVAEPFAHPYHGFRSWQARWTALGRVPVAPMSNLLADYFSAWRDRSVETLEEIFDKTASYHEKPFDEPILGLEGIKKYWRQKVLMQRDLTLKFGRIASVRNGAVVEFQAEFSVDQIRTAVLGVIVFELTPDRSRIARLREYFRAIHGETREISVQSGDGCG